MKCTATLTTAKGVRRYTLTCDYDEEDCAGQTIHNNDEAGATWLDSTPGATPHRDDDPLADVLRVAADMAADMLDTPPADDCSCETCKTIKSFMVPDGLPTGDPCRLCANCTDACSNPDCKDGRIRGSSIQGRWNYPCPSCGGTGGGVSDTVYAEALRRVQIIEQRGEEYARGWLDQFLPWLLEAVAQA